jgi:hypothetical protein
MKDGEFTADVSARSDDFKVEIFIPKGTVARSVFGTSISSIRIQRMVGPPLRPKNTVTVGLVYEIGPAGATFEPPVDLIMEYDVADIPAKVAQKNLVVAAFDDSTGQWTYLESTVDIVNDTVTAKISHFSAFAILALTRPASFTVTHLSFTPGEVNLGESVSISVLVTNTGDLTDNYKINLKINNWVVQTKEVILDGGDSKTVTFSVTPDTVGEYTVNIMDLLGIFAVKVPEAPPEPTPAPVVKPAPTRFAFSDLSVVPSVVEPAEQVTITAVVTNTGDREGSCTVVLKINGAEEARKEVDVAVGKSETVTFTVGRDVEGSYFVNIDSEIGRFMVIASTTPAAPPLIAPDEPAEPPATPLSLSVWIIIAVVAAGLIGGTVIMLVIKLRILNKA